MVCLYLLVGKGMKFMFWLTRVGLTYFIFYGATMRRILTLHSTNLFFLYQPLLLDKENLVRGLQFYFYGAKTRRIF